MPNLEEKIQRLKKFIRMTEKMKPGGYVTRMWKHIRINNQSEIINKLPHEIGRHILLLKKSRHDGPPLHGERKSTFLFMYEETMRALAKQQNRLPALFLAAFYGMPEFMQDLLDYGADMNHKIRVEYPDAMVHHTGILAYTLKNIPRFKRFYPRINELTEEMLTVLLKNGADAKETYTDTCMPPEGYDSYDIQETELPTVRLCSNLGHLKLFLDYGVDPDVKLDLYGDCLLNCSDVPKLRMLIEAGADPKKQDIFGNTPLHELLEPDWNDDDEKIDIEPVKFLLGLDNVDLSIKNEEGKTVRALAAELTDKTALTLIDAEIARRTQATQAPRYYLRNRSQHQENHPTSIQQITGEKRAAPF